MLLIVIRVDVVNGQKIYATYDPSGLTNTGGSKGTGAGGASGLGTFQINNPQNVNDNILGTSFASLNATSGKSNLTTIGNASSAFIILDFSGSKKPQAGSRIVIKLTATEIAKVQIQERIGSSDVGTVQTFSNLSKAANDEYIFIPTVNCDAIKITLNTGEGLLFGTATNSANLYYAYTFDASCHPASNTDTRTTSILDLLSKINNPFNAIDGDLTSYSSFSFGLGVATTLYQTIYFPNPSGAKDAATLTVSIPPAVLSAGILSYINITAYNGTTAIQTITFGSLLMGTDLLTLLNSGQPATISFSPGAAFDRIEFSMSTLVGLAATLNLHEVEITPSEPSFPSLSAQNITICAGSAASLTPNVPESGNELRWYTEVSGGSPIFIGNSFNPTPMVNTTYYVSSGKPGCLAESERAQTKVTVTQLAITIDNSVPSIVCQGLNKAVINYNGLVCATQYSISWNSLASAVDFLPSSGLLENGNISIPIPTSAPPNEYSGSLIVSNGTATTASIPFTIKINPKAQTPIVAPSIIN